MLHLIIASIYFILPAYAANMCPVIFKFLPLGNKPINEKLFGSHKTWRGFYTAYFGALLMLLLQAHLQNNISTQPVAYFDFSSDPQNIITQIPVFVATLLDYQAINLYLYAFLFGIGALTGDLIKSYFKHKLKIPPGSPWFPFDQLDFVLGALLFLWPFYQLPWLHIWILLLVTPILHFLTNLTAYALHLKKVWY